MKVKLLNPSVPVAMTGESTLFDPNSEQGKAAIARWKHNKKLAAWCSLLAVPPFFLQWWWALPILAFIGLSANGQAEAIASKADSGFPYLEHTDAIGSFFGGCLLFALCAAAFWGSFYLPSDGWR